jgi:coxsackievirus/adenovirus receptor
MTEFGCCPDGLTAAFGPKYAGCPSECMCNGLGSVALTCHPVTGQCPCKSAVGGLRCDRCEPSYWGLQNIGTNGKTGCTPCGCNVFGSVREDCDQMNGKCLCRPGITGPKCTVCPNGSHVGPHGCIGQDNMQNDFPAAAMTKSSRRCSKTGPARCRYGAFCDVTGRCVCQDACSIGDVTEVCGSDAVTYKSRCYLRLASCQQHKRIVVAYSGHC